MSLIDRVVGSNASEWLGTAFLALGTAALLVAICVSGSNLRTVTGEQIATCVSLCPDGISKFIGNDECVCKSGIATKVLKP